MNNNEHQLEKLSFKVEFPEQKEAFKLQDQLFLLVEKSLKKIIEEAFNDVDIKNSLVKIHKIEVDLGIIDREEIEEKLPSKLKSALNQKLHSTLTKISFLPSEEEEITTESASKLDLLIFFLKYGYLPWWGRTIGHSSQLIDDILQDLLLNHPTILYKQLRRVASNTRVLQRMIWQFSEENLSRIITIQNTYTQNYVKKNIRYLKILHQDNSFYNTIGSDFLKLVWEFLLIGSFNKSISSQNNLQFILELIDFLVSKRKGTKQQLLEVFNKSLSEARKTHIFEEQFINAIETVIKQEQQEEAITTSGSDNIVQVSDLFEIFLATGKTSKVESESHMTFPQIWNYLSQNSPKVLVSISKFNWNKNKTVQTILGKFSEKQKIQLVQIAEPSNSEYIINYKKSLVKAEQEKPTLNVSQYKYNKAIWEFIFNYLFVEKGTQFSKKTFLQSIIQQISNRYQIDIIQLISNLQLAVKTLVLPTSLRNELPVFLTEIAQNLVKDSKLRQKPDLIFEEAQVQGEQVDILKYFLMYGVVPWHERQKIKETQISEIILQLLKDNPLQFQQVLSEIPQANRQKVVKRLRSQLNTETAQVVFKKFEQLLSVPLEVQEEEILSLQNLQKDLSLISSFIYAYLQKRVFPQKADFTFEQLTQLFFEEFQQESAFFISKLDEVEKKELQKLISDEAKKQLAELEKKLQDKIDEKLEEAIQDLLEKGLYDRTVWSKENLEEKVKDFLLNVPNQAVTFLKKGLQKSDTIKNWVKQLSEKTLSHLVFTINPTQYGDIIKTSDLLIQAVLRTNWGKQQSLNLKRIKWEFVFQYLAEYGGNFQTYTFTKRFLEYLSDAASSFQEMPSLEVLEKLKDTSISIKIEDIANTLQEEILEEQVHRSQSQREKESLGRRLRELQKKKLSARLDELIESQRHLLVLNHEYKQIETGLKTLDSLLEDQNLVDIETTAHFLEQWETELKSLEVISLTLNEITFQQVSSLEQLKEMLKSAGISDTILSSTSFSRILFESLVIDLIEDVLEIHPQKELLDRTVVPLPKLLIEKIGNELLQKQGTFRKEVEQLLTEGKDSYKFLKEPIKAFIQKTIDDLTTSLEKEESLQQKDEQQEILKQQIKLQKKDAEIRKEELEQEMKELEEEENEKREVEAKLQKMEEEENYLSQANLSDDELEEAIYISNAGLILVHPYLFRLFNMLEYLDKRAFKSNEMMVRAAHVLQYIATKEEQVFEHDLTLNKLLCGIPLNLPMEREIELTDFEKKTSDGMLQGVIQNWSALKKTSSDSLRNTFLKREGKLKKEIDGWHLNISKSAVDILLDRIPWGFGLIKLPWMEDVLHVIWK